MQVSYIVLWYSCVAVDRGIIIIEEFCFLLILNIRYQLLGKGHRIGLFGIYVCVYDYCITFFFFYIMVAWQSLSSGDCGIDWFLL